MCRCLVAFIEEAADTEQFLAVGLSSRRLESIKLTSSAKRPLAAFAGLLSVYLTFVFLVFERLSNWSSARSICLRRMAVDDFFFGTFDYLWGFVGCAVVSRLVARFFYGQIRLA